MYKKFKKDYLDINFLLTRKLKLIYLFVFLLGFLVNILEIIGVGSIAIFAGILLEPTKFLSPYQNYSFINYIINIDNSSRTLIFSSILIFVFLIKGIVIFVSNFLANKFQLESIIYVSSKLFRSYIYQDYVFHLKNNPSNLNQRIHHETNHAIMYFDWIIKFLNSIILIFGLMLLLLFNSSLVAFLNLSLVALLILISRYVFLSKIKLKSKIRSENDLKLFKIIQHAFGSFIETVLFKKEKFFNTYFQKYLRIREFQTFYLNVMNSLPKIIIEILVVFLICFYLIIFMKSQADLFSFLPSLTLIVISLARLMPALSQLLLSVNQLKFLEYGKNTIVEEIRKTKDENIERVPEKQSKKLNFKENIKIENLSFGYDDKSDVKIIENLSLKINLGDKIAIIGESGVGKSTFINLLTGLLRPLNGEIFLDGKSIFKDIKGWQSIISYIPQEIYLIDDTIEKNITFSTENDYVDQKWIEEVLRLSNIYSYIQDLEHGAQTLVGNRGIRFSGGQKQRIAIARAIYKKPKILIMDEPTSGLDSENEKKIMENIFSISEKVTLIMITHNIGRYRDKFKVFKLENRSLKEE